MHFGDYTFILLLALVLFGPKKLPEIGRQLGKLLAEFRRASNEFKYQIQEELRNMEEEERRKKLAEQQAAQAQAAVVPPAPATTPTILPPSTGTQVSTASPYATPVETAEPTPVSPAAAPATAEVAVDPPAPTQVAVASEPVVSSASPAHIDLTTHTNGSHAPASEIEHARHD